MERRQVQVIHLQMVKDKEIPYGRIEMREPRGAAALVKDFLGEVDRECLVVCGVDTKMKPTYIQMVAMGAVNYCPAPMPEIFKAALLTNATYILLFHNHTSGDCTPSEDDIFLTERVLEVGKLLGIQVVDHIILGEGDKFCSLRESNRFLEWESIN